MKEKTAILLRHLQLPRMKQAINEVSEDRLLRYFKVFYIIFI